MNPSLKKFLVGTAIAGGMMMPMKSMAQNNPVPADTTVEKTEKGSNGMLYTGLGFGVLYVILVGYCIAKGLSKGNKPAPNPTEWEEKSIEFSDVFVTIRNNKSHQKSEDWDEMTIADDNIEVIVRKKQLNQNQR